MKNFVVKTSLGILILLVLVEADVEKSNTNFNQRCQTLNCNPTTEICLRTPNCDDSKQDDPLKCYYCAFKSDPNPDIVSKTLLTSSISQQKPLAPRLLAKSGTPRLLADSRGLATTPITGKSVNKTTDELSYDDYYEYDEEENTDKNDLGEEDEYLDDYAEPIDSIVPSSNTIRKIGICPKAVEPIGKCDSSKPTQSECRFDTDCTGDHKCCESSCGQRVCRAPITKSVSVCPLSFTCTLNCRLGYRTDANGCLLCECQSCPSMDRCNKNCPSGYLKDLFGCDICECSDQCPPFSCGLHCPKDVGFAKSSDGCPLCQCATTKSKPTEYTTSCQDDVHCPPGFRCLNDARNVPMCQAVSELDEPPSPTKECPTNLATTCNLRCTNGNYLLDTKGCPTCACTSEASIKRIGRPPINCPLVKCTEDCGDRGYKLNANGCRTCECSSVDSKGIASKPRVECSDLMCRMHCVHGFRRDENECELCQCNDSPQPCPKLNCQNTCSNGYRKDYSGCPTCKCNGDKSQKTIDDNNGCSPMTNCKLNCKYGYERDLVGCQLCSCNQCPVQKCRMYCMYGFKKNNDGCDVCECNWEPVSENIQCSERIPCKGNRVCNVDLHLCELVSGEKINYFVYDFDIDTKLYNDPKFVATFKNGLINNIATKYGLEPAQILVSSVERNGITGFQIMPYYLENMGQFQRKMDQIDLDLSSKEFRTVLPAVVNAVDKNMHVSSKSLWSLFVNKKCLGSIYGISVLIGIVALILAGLYIFITRQCNIYPRRSESKSPIFDTPYHPAPTEEEQYHAVHAPDGTAYVVVENEDSQPFNDRKALV
ncbi:hypothetical protein I4U23_028989 [Adineta vaga]|nr:hypothetical protein I4U23_028989 [Adineta vaga]